MSTLRAKSIVSNSRVLGGKPILAGTRLSVEFILELLRSRMTFDEIIDEYPSLTQDDLEAVLTFAKRAVADEELYPLESISQAR